MSDRWFPLRQIRFAFEGIIEGTRGFPYIFYPMSPLLLQSTHFTDELRAKTTMNGVNLLQINAFKRTYVLKMYET